MPEILQFGPFMVKFSWLIAGVGGIIGYEVMKRRLKQTPFPYEKILDIYTTSLMIVALVWKMGPLIFDPSILWNNPLSILFITGTIKHMWLGIFFAIGYIYLKLRKAQIPISVMLDVLPYGFLTLIVIYHLFIWQYGSPTTMLWGISIQHPDYRYHPVNVYQVFVTLPVLIWLWRRKFSLGIGMVFSHFLSFYGAGQMLVSFFKPQTVYFLGLSVEQLVYLGLLVIGNLVSYQLNNQEVKPHDETRIPEFDTTAFDDHEKRLAD